MAAARTFFGQSMAAVPRILSQDCFCSCNYNSFVLFVCRGVGELKQKGVIVNGSVLSIILVDPAPLE